jgi:hypothetical protein
LENNEKDLKVSLREDKIIDRFIINKDKELREELTNHSETCEEETKLVKLNQPHYKREHCGQSSYNQESVKGQSPLDYGLYKQKT